jgi:hypothetical protein
VDFLHFLWTGRSRAAFSVIGWERFWGKRLWRKGEKLLLDDGLVGSRGTILVITNDPARKWVQDGESVTSKDGHTDSDFNHSGQWRPTHYPVSGMFLCAHEQPDMFVVASETSPPLIERDMGLVPMTRGKALRSLNSSLVFSRHLLSLRTGRVHPIDQAMRSLSHHHHTHNKCEAEVWFRNLVHHCFRKK